MNFLLLLFHIGVLFFVARWANKKWYSDDTKLYWLALVYHVSFGIAVGLVYLFYYTYDDTWTYFSDSEKLAALAKNNFSSYLSALADADSSIANHIAISNEEWRSVFFVKILSVLNLVTLNNYWICAAYFSLISFFSCWHLHKVVCIWKPQATYASALAFLFFPSVAFWGAGIEKETLAISGVFFLASCMLQFMTARKLNATAWLLMLLSIFIVWKLRYFWLAVFLLVGVPTLIVMYLVKKRISKFKILLGSLAALAIAFVSVSFIHPNFSPAIFLEILIQNNRAFVALSDSRQVIHFHQLTPTWGSIIINSPWALFSGLFRPFIWEAPSLPGLLASLENFFLLVMTIFYVLNFKRVLHSKSSVLFLGSLAYIAILCIFLTLSTPNFGSLSRYRIGFLPFFVFITSYKNPLLMSLKGFLLRKRPH